MTTVYEHAATALTSLGVPLAANAYVLATGAALPDIYIVYFVVSEPPAQHADNAETLRTYRMQVSIYSRSGLNALPDSVHTAMIAAGFTHAGGRDLPYNPDTRHFGRALDYFFLEER